MDKGEPDGRKNLGQPLRQGKLAPGGDCSKAILLR